MANRSRPTPKSDEEEWEQTLVVRGRGVQDRQPTSGYCCIRANFVSLCNLINLGSQVMRMQKTRTPISDQGTLTIICKELMQSNEGKKMDGDRNLLRKQERNARG